MKYAPIPSYERERLCSVEGLHLLDTGKEERFDKITREAMIRFAVPISTIAIIDSDREWFKSAQGLDKKEGPRNISFCGHALLKQEIMIIEDTLRDPIFSDNPMVTSDKGIRFYAGKSLYDRKANMPVGVFCIKDYEPRVMSAVDITVFLDMATQAEDELNKNPSKM